MKIIIEDIGPDEEEEIIIRCREVDEPVLQLVNGLKLKKEKLTVRNADKILQIDPGEHIVWKWQHAPRSSSMPQIVR